MLCLPIFPKPTIELNNHSFHVGSSWFWPLIYLVCENAFGDAFACIIIIGCHYLAFGLFRFIRYVFPLAPSAYVMATKGFGYFLTNAISIGWVRRIFLPKSPS